MPQDQVNIVGAGIVGLLAAYYLKKSIPDPDKIKIDIYDRQDEKKLNNASTNSLGWINNHYPPKKGNNADYDLFRTNSMKDWETLIKDLEKDGFIDVTTKEKLTINNQEISSLFFCFSSDQEGDFLKKTSRFSSHNIQYPFYKLSRQDITQGFPFLKDLPDTVCIYNVAHERLINTKRLIRQLITFLKQSGVQFHWNTPVTPESIQSEPETQWIIAAGGECPSFAEKTKLEDVNFDDTHPANIINCTLKKPIDLKGAVLHFASTSTKSTTPSFHLRNKHGGPQKMQIIVTRQTNMKEALDTAANNIFKLLGFEVKKYRCNNTVQRPMTPDGRPLVEINCGKNSNIHFIFGHSLYTNAARLFPSFANALISRLYSPKQHPSLPFVTCQPNNLTSFASAGRFTERKTKRKLKPLDQCSLFSSTTKKQRNDEPDHVILSPH